MTRNKLKRTASHTWSHCHWGLAQSLSAVCLPQMHRCLLTRGQGWQSPVCNRKVTFRVGIAKEGCFLTMKTTTQRSKAAGLPAWQEFSQACCPHSNVRPHGRRQDHSLALHLRGTGLAFLQWQVVVTIFGQGGQGPKYRKKEYLMVIQQMQPWLHVLFSEF